MFNSITLARLPLRVDVGHDDSRAVTAAPPCSRGRGPHQPGGDPAVAELRVHTQHGDNPHLEILKLKYPSLNVKQLKTSLPYFGVKLSCACLMFAYRKKSNKCPYSDL